MSTFTPLQDFVLKHYEGGEFEHVSDSAELKHCGDTLLIYAFHEAGDAEDFDDLKRMLERAVDQLRSVIGEIEDQPFVEQSVSEGWDVFNVDGRMMLQRCDEAEIFETDLDALLFVAEQALKGSVYHRNALEKIGRLA